MSGMTDHDVRGASVIVVGAGASGLSAAWWLARDGVDVLVLDRGIAGWEASGRNGGGCTHHFSPLFAEEQRLWPMMDDLLGYPTEFSPGRIRIAFSERHMQLYGRAVTNAEHQGFHSDTLDGDAVRALVPLAGEGPVGGYHHRFGGHANPHRTVQGYAWALQDLGGRLMQQTEVLGFDLRGGQARGVRTTRGSIACDHLVIAAGPGTARLAAMLDVHVPMVAARAEMVITEPLPLMPIGGVDGNGLYGRQTLRGNLAYGGGPHEWLEEGDGPPPRSSTPLALHIAARLAELLPRAAHARVIRSWAQITLAILWPHCFLEQYSISYVTRKRRSKISRNNLTAQHLTAVLTVTLFSHNFLLLAEILPLWDSRFSRPRSRTLQFHSLPLRSQPTATPPW